MDELIRQYFHLLEQYASLQHDLGQSTATAFIRQSRARYNGIKLATDQFDLDLTSFVTVTHTIRPESSCRKNDDYDRDEKHVSNGIVSRRPEDEECTDVEKIAASLSGTTLVDNESSIATVKNMDHTLDERFSRSMRLETSDEKKHNPMRKIETLPSPALRTTQSAFHDMLKLAIRAANLLIRLQHVQSEIDAQRMELTVPEQIVPTTTTKMGQT